MSKTNDTSSPAALEDHRPLADSELDAVSGGLFGFMGEILSNVSKTRSEISMTFARNARA